MRNRIKATLLLNIVVLGGCGVSPQSKANVLTDIEVVAISTSTTVSATTLPPLATTTSVVKKTIGVIGYFIRAEGLVGKAYVVDSEYTEAQLLALLIDEPNPVNDTQGLRSGLSQRGDLIDGVSVNNYVVRVNLNSQFNELPGSEQVLILGQITLTLSTNLLIGGVEFSQGDQVIAVPDANGQPLARPANRNDYIELLSRT